jgi:hypothetical protein
VTNRQELPRPKVSAVLDALKTSQYSVPGSTGNYLVVFFLEPSKNRVGPMSETQVLSFDIIGPILPGVQVNTAAVVEAASNYGNQNVVVHFLRGVFLKSGKLVINKTIDDWEQDLAHRFVTRQLEDFMTTKGDYEG